MELPFVTVEFQSLLWWDTSPACQASHQWRACPRGWLWLWLWLWLVLCDEDGISSVSAAESDPGHSFQHLQANTGCQSPPWAGNVHQLGPGDCALHSAWHSLTDPLLPLGCASLVLQQKGAFVPTNAESTSAVAGNTVD